MAAEQRLGSDIGDKAAAARKARLRTTLYNVHAYYSQFSAPLERAISAKRGEIENKLKDAVKLAQVSAGDTN